jgi:hypothetical protein
MNLRSPERSPKPNGRVSIGRSQLSRRRSSRIALNARMVLSGQDVQKCPFTMPAKATGLNRHGAAIQLHRGLVVGSTVAVKNQRGTIVAALVVAQLATLEGVPTYGIEFEPGEKARNFWGITFPSTTG